MEEVKIGDMILVRAKIKEIIYDEKGKHYKIVIKDDNFNAVKINPEDIIVD